jgi:hypothetical protein
VLGTRVKGLQERTVENRPNACRLNWRWLADCHGAQRICEPSFNPELPEGIWLRHAVAVVQKKKKSVIFRPHRMVVEALQLTSRRAGTLTHT